MWVLRVSRKYLEVCIFTCTTALCCYMYPGLEESAKEETERLLYARLVCTD